METEKVVSEMEELPKTIVRRVVKDKLNECSPDTDITVNKDSLLAFSESARIFIHYLSATANDICKESKRQTINADDVLKAIEEIDFPEFVGPLKASLDEFRQKNAGKRAVASKSKEEKKKQKVEDEPSKISKKTKQDKDSEENEE
ncbi:DNA polymerase epsilon subunit 3 isoform X1 [Pistacia vera]|uniref:DNA polymerase epsilon subunit 3 isoform X1 n=1 Tax=Pistacia vera TaxID=55513 RepID=UPI001262C5B3|nr:DNA polymerase epsilon subunit 3 isoform X1 [Pistacia vera]